MSRILVAEVETYWHDWHYNRGTNVSQVGSAFYTGMLSHAVTLKWQRVHKPRHTIRRFSRKLKFALKYNAAPFGKNIDIYRSGQEVTKRYFWIIIDAASVEAG
jgi:hypothetical protein